jgi:hypothetical protein
LKHALGERQFDGLQTREALTHDPFTHCLGGRQDGLQLFSAASTINLRDTVKPGVEMLSFRSPPDELWIKKDKVKLRGVPSRTWMLVTRSKLMSICDGPTCERSRKPLELTVNVDKAPALTLLGEILMGA